MLSFHFCYRFQNGFASFYYIHIPDLFCRQESRRVKALRGEKVCWWGVLERNWRGREKPKKKWRGIKNIHEKYQCRANRKNMHNHQKKIFKSDYKLGSRKESTPGLLQLLNGYDIISTFFAIKCFSWPKFDFIGR